MLKKNLNLEEYNYNEDKYLEEMQDNIINNYENDDN